MTDRRKSGRLPVLLEVLCEGAASKYEARTSDISLGGCFIDTIAKVVVGETISFKLCMPSGEWLELQGEVEYELPQFGFGVSFTNLSEKNQKELEALITAQQ